MSGRYSIAEARSSLPAIVGQAEAGQEIELTRRGKPVAVVVSLGELVRVRRARPHFADAYRRFRKAHVLRGGREGYFEATRGRDAGRKVDL
ncbi:MAG: type II toxin-antitoxin system Phd/YefM family antitoxin [Gemmatimonadota bacterium]